jgi:aminoglycoside phosphotransferase (APT) family kinase protein
MEEICRAYGITSDIKPLGSGCDVVVYPVDDVRVLRLYKRADKALRTRLEAKRAFYDSLDRTKVSFEVPEVLSIGTSHGMVYTLDKRLRGEELNAEYKALSDTAKHSALKSYVMAAQDIHNLSPVYPYFGEILKESPIREPSWSGYLLRKIYLAWQQGQKVLSEDFPDIRQVIELLEEGLSLFDDVHDATLVHGDYYGPNVLMQRGRVTAVLDFSDLTVAGDFRMDVASSIMSLDAETTDVKKEDVKVLIEKLALQYGERIRGIIQFYKLFYALCFASNCKESDPVTYKWALGAMQQETNGMGE